MSCVCFKSLNTLSSMLEISSLVVLCLLIESAVGVDVQESFMFMFNHFVFSFVDMPSQPRKAFRRMIWGLIATVDRCLVNSMALHVSGGQSALSALEGL